MCSWRSLTGNNGNNRTNSLVADLSHLASAMEERRSQEFLSPASPDIENASQGSSGQLLKSSGQGVSGGKSIACLLCNNDQHYETQDDFEIHLTVIHFREKLMKMIQEPFRCSSCRFEPSDTSPHGRSEELLMHYGINEKMALKYYLAETKNVPQPAVEKLKANIVCKMCDKMFPSDRYFIRHITLRHFKEELTRKLPQESESGPLVCPYPRCESRSPNFHTLLLHYGGDHDISLKLYKEATKETEDLEKTSSPSEPTQCSPLLARYREKVNAHQNSLMTSPPAESGSVPRPPVAKPKVVVVPQPTPRKPSSEENSVPCKICPMGSRKFSNKQSLKHHVFFAHFFPDLPKSGSCSCPVCEAKFPIRNVFASHFIEKHYSDYYRQKFGSEKSDRRKEETGEKAKTLKTFDLFSQSQKKSNRHSTSKRHKSKSRHRSPRREKRRSQESSSKDEYEDANDEIPLPLSRVMQTIHSDARSRSPVDQGGSTAKQRLMETWKKDSIDSLRFETDQLRAKLLEMETDYAEALKKKSEDFERWITQKEKSLEEEQEKRREAHDKAETLAAKLAEVESKFSQQTVSGRYLEEELSERSKQVDTLLAEKRRMEKESSELRQEVESLKQQEESSVALWSERLREKENAISSLQENVQNLQDANDTLEVEKVKLQKNVESQAKKIEKLNEEKKGKLVQIKEMTKNQHESEAQLRAQISELAKQNKQLNIKLNSQINAMEKSAKTEIKRLEKNNDKIEKQLEDYESQVKEANATIEKLESQKSNILDSFCRIQKILQDFESVIHDRNAKVADLEVLLEESVDKVNRLKTVEKEKKDLQKELKHLKSTMQDWESRQFTNLKLISGLEREKAELKEKVKNFEENNTGTEEELYELSSNLRKHEKEAKKWKEKFESLEAEMSKSNARMQEKNEEFSQLVIKKDELEQRIRNLERELRDKSNPSGEFEHLQQVVSNKEAELLHLRTTLRSRQIEINRLKAQNADLEAEMKTLKNSLEASQVEAIKKKYKEAARDLALKKEVLADVQRLIESWPSMDQILDGRADRNKEWKANLASIKDCLAESSNFRFMTIKQEPRDPNESTVENRSVIPSVNVDSGKSIQVSIANSYSIGPASVKHEAIAAPNVSEEEDVDPLNMSHIEFDLSTSSNAVVAKSVEKKKPRKRKPKLPDVTNEILPDEDNTVCGICENYDPPRVSGMTAHQFYKTEWVGCDCGKWFHKQCTALQRFSINFSCKSVKMKCTNSSKRKKRSPSVSRKPSNNSDASNQSLVEALRAHEVGGFVQYSF